MLRAERIAELCHQPKVVSEVSRIICISEAEQTDRAGHRVLRSDDGIFQASR